MTIYARTATGPRPIEVYQGEDASIPLTTSSSVSASTEIEVTIDTSPQIVLTLTGSHIGSVTSTGFTVTIAVALTADVKPGPYKWQARVTIAGSISHVKIVSDQIKILPSVFENSRNIHDYGG